MTPTLLALLFAPSGQAGGGLSVLLFQVALIFGIFYFLIIRPQRRQREQHAKLLAGLQKGDQIVTSGGIVGEVVHLKDNEITIRSGESKLVVLRANIASVNRPGEAAESAPAASPPSDRQRADECRGG
jgi:preprotein translocase subunit YajC